MAAFNDLNSLMSAIDNLDIYEKDYKTIAFLIENTDAKFFTKALEEVLEGNLYWSDFETILSPEYREQIRLNLKSQKDLNDYINRYIAFRRFINSDYDYDYEKGGLFIRNGTGTSVDTLFDEEYKRIRDDILNNLTTERPGDNALTKALKIRLYNAIKNGELLLKLQKDNNVPSNISVSDTKITNTTNGEEYDYINPNDIFLFINSYTIPLDTEHQVLSEFDKAYMTKYNLDEETVKHFKSLGILLRKKAYYANNN